MLVRVVLIALFGAPMMLIGAYCANKLIRGDVDEATVKYEIMGGRYFGSPRVVRIIYIAACIMAILIGLLIVITGIAI